MVQKRKETKTLEKEKLKAGKTIYQWVDVSEHLPEEYKVVVVYLDVEKKYGLAAFTPYDGWVDTFKEHVRYVKYWLDSEIPFVFEAEDIDIGVLYKPPHPDSHYERISLIYNK